MWWRLDGWPSAEEWQAFWAFISVLVAIVGLAFAGYQLRQSAISARRAAEAEEARTRPYVSVRMDLEVHASGDPKKDNNGEGIIYVIVESVGATPAVDIALSVTPAWRTSGRGKPSAGSDPVMDTLKWVFSGERVISMLGPSERLRYFLDFAREAMNSDNDLPKRYEIVATYGDAAGRRYTSRHVIDFAPWGYTIMQANSLDVIARQLRRVNENLERS